MLERSLGRRRFIAALCTAAISPVAAFGERTRRIGFMIQLAESDPEGQVRVAAFREELRKLGWRVGDNIGIDYRWGSSNDELARAGATELLARAPDAILANSTVNLRALQRATNAVPIVFTTVIDPVGQGFVASLAHPGGNITGFSYLEASVGGKWLDLLKQIAPQIERVAFMFNPQRGPFNVGVSRFAEATAQKLAMQCVVTPVRDPGDIEAAMTKLASEPGGGLIVAPDAFTITHSQPIIDLAARYKLPAIYAERNVATEGGLVSYGADYVEHFRQAATYVDKILRGARPADLPVQEPSKFLFVINLKTAKALGLTVPPNMLDLADEVIE
jgi:putative tryptophan/tyrosine transport system substrate-binding protein